MKKRFFALLTLLAVTFSIFGFSSGVLAYDSEGSVYVTRGGNSKTVNSDYKGNAGSWEAAVTDAYVQGLPAHIYGNNYIVMRMYTADGTNQASSTLTISPNYYNVYRSQTYWTEKGYGGIGQTYCLKASMSSSSTSSYGTFQIRFCA